MKELMKFIKFMLIGVLNTFVDNGIFYLFISQSSMDKSIAKAISYLLAMVNSYVWNKYWTFREKSDHHAGQIVKFILVNLVSLGVNIWILNLSGEWMVGIAKKGGASFSMNQDIRATGLLAASLLLATPLSLLVNFLGNRLLVFKEKRNEN